MFRIYKMIQLQYTQQDLVSNPDLMSSVQILIMLGWKIQNRTLYYDGSYTPPLSIYPFILAYTCLIKMSVSDRQWEVYDGMPDRIINEAQAWEPEQIRILTRSERKDHNFDEPFEHEGFVYVPSDIHNWYMTGQQLQVMISNWCEIITTQEYTSLLPEDNL